MSAPLRMLSRKELARRISRSPSKAEDVFQLAFNTPRTIAAGLLRGTVLLNVRGRDVGSFVDEAKARLANQVQLPPGYFMDWSGQYENQRRARQRLMIVIPIVLVIIFGLLYLTYNSVLEAAHVLLAVPFALTGGVYLLWALCYH